MEEGLEALVEIKSHQRECAIRYENIEKRLEMLLWGVYPFIVVTMISAKLL